MFTINTNDIQYRYPIPLGVIPYRKGLFFQAKREQILLLLQSWIDKEDMPFKYNKSQTAIALKECASDGVSVFCFKARSARLKQAVVCIEVGPNFFDLKDIYKNGTTLDYYEYNKVFDAFMDAYVSEEIKKSFLLSIYKSYGDLSEFMGDATSVALEEWEESCIKDDDMPFECDMDLWNNFVTASYMYHSGFTSNLLRDFIKEYSCWPERLYDKIEYFANLYDYSIPLLEMHDKELGLCEYVSY